MRSINWGAWVVAVTVAVPLTAALIWVMGAVLRYGLDKRLKLTLARARAGLLPMVMPVAECPSCKQALFGHWGYSLGGVVLFDDVNRMAVAEEFQRSVEVRDWVGLQTRHAFDATKDALEARALKCPDGSIAVLTVFDPFELYDNQRIVATAMLSESESIALDALINQQQWLPVVVKK